ncbi:hypothetical protein J5X98_05135 [Leptothermofonsia sichuanensis E412]|nr:hypothetical protein [Leptothermofonsia sichuanensis]QZZ21823.1 hypothetical protein J5X98_05135 [Leptothermofonsia sichuanensis E412]
MAETLMGQTIAIGQRSHAVFKVQPTYGGNCQQAHHNPGLLKKRPAIVK